MTRPPHPPAQPELPPPRGRDERKPRTSSVVLEAFKAVCAALEPLEDDEAVRVLMSVSVLRDLPVSMDSQVLQ